MKNRFIILVDFSDYSVNQIKYAKKWSEINNAEMILVHHTTPLIPTMTDDKSKEEIRRNTNITAREELIKLAAQSVSDTSNFGYLASEKDTEEIISDLLKEHQYNNIIIIGLRGTNNTIRKILMGSFALNVIENSKNIVVTLPKDAREFDKDSIYVAVSKQYPLNFKQFDKFLATFNESKPTVKFFSVIKSNEDANEAQTYLDEIENHYNDKISIVQYLIQGDDVLSEVKGLLDNHPGNLLVIQKGSRLFVDKIFRRFLINDLMHDGNIPLVILP